MVACEAWPLVDAKLAQAATLLGAGRAPLPVDDRIAILRRLASLIARDAESLALQIAEEGGKPLVDAWVDLRPAQSESTYTRILSSFMRPSRAESHLQAAPRGTSPASSRGSCLQRWVS